MPPRVRAPAVAPPQWTGSVFPWRTVVFVVVAVIGQVVVCILAYCVWRVAIVLLVQLLFFSPAECHVARVRQRVRNKAGSGNPTCPLIVPIGCTPGARGECWRHLDRSSRPCQNNAGARDCLGQSPTHSETRRLESIPRCMSKATGRTLTRPLEWTSTRYGSCLDWANQKKHGWYTSRRTCQK